MKQFILSLLLWFLKTRAMPFWYMEYTTDKHLCSSTQINSPLYFFFSHMCQTFMRIVPSLLNPIHSYIWIRTDLPRNGFIHCNHLFPKYDSYIRPTLVHQHGDRNKFVTKKRKEFLHLDVLFCLSLNSFLNVCNCYMYL